MGSGVEAEPIWKPCLVSELSLAAGPGRPLSVRRASRAARTDCASSMAGVFLDCSRRTVPYS